MEGQLEQILITTKALDDTLVVECGQSVVLREAFMEMIHCDWSKPSYTPNGIRGRLADMVRISLDDRAPGVSAIMNQMRRLIMRFRTFQDILTSVVNPRPEKI